MKAVVCEHLGRPVGVRDVPLPEPGPKEIQVRVVAAGVNPIDWKLCERGDRRMPFVLGQDFAGVVSDVGNRVTKYRVADRVFGIARDHGAYAQFTVIPEDDGPQPIAKVPAEVGDADAAALPTAGLTALAALDWLGVGRGTSVLIVGATGGVGSYAVQMARDRGAHIVGTAAGTSEPFARELGVDEFVAYDRDDVAASVRQTHPDGVDAVLDLVDDARGIGRIAGVVRSGGKIVSTIGAIDPQALRERELSGNNLSMQQSPASSHAGLRALLEMLERGAVRTFIASEEPLEEATRALERSKRGTVNGKLILTVD